MSDLIVSLEAPPHADEKAWGIAEFNAIEPNGHAWHRYQRITVVRNDCEARWVEDLGPADQYHDAGFVIPSFFEMSVGELRDMALEMRESTRGAEKRREMSAESTLWQDFERQYDEDSKLLRNASTFGPGGVVQRNGYSRLTATENKRKASE